MSYWCTSEAFPIRPHYYHDQCLYSTVFFHCPRGALLNSLFSERNPKQCAVTKYGLPAFNWYSEQRDKCHQQQQSRWKQMLNCSAENSAQLENSFRSDARVCLCVWHSLSEDFRIHTGGFGLTAVSRAVFWTLLPSLEEPELVETRRLGGVNGAPAIVKKK